MAKPSLPASFSDTAEHKQIKQRINAKFKYVHSHDDRPADPLRAKTDQTKLPSINATKGRAVTFSRSSRAMKDQSDKKAQTGLSVFTILKYDHTKQESSLACLGLDSGSLARPPERTAMAVPHPLPTRPDIVPTGDLNSESSADRAAAGQLRRDHGPSSAGGSAHGPGDGDDGDKRQPGQRQSAEGTSDAAEPLVISSAVRRFRNFIMKETSRRDQHQESNDDLLSHASQEMSLSLSLTVSTRSELGSQMSSRKTYPGRARPPGHGGGRDSDPDDAFGYTPSDSTTNGNLSKTNGSSRERDGYFTPYRYSIRPDRSIPDEALARRRKPPNRTTATRRSSSKIDISKLNKMKTTLAQNSPKEQPGQVGLPSVIDAQGNYVDQTSEPLGLENELGRARPPHCDWFSHRTRTSRFKPLRSEDDGGGGGQNVSERRAGSSYQWKADLTQPIAFIRGAGKPTLGSEYGMVRGKYRLLRPEHDKVDEARSVQHKAAILRRLKGIFKKRGSHKSTSVCECGGSGDASSIQLATMEPSAKESRRMRGGKVQRGTFLTRHSKWVNNFQSLQEEGLVPQDAADDPLVTRSTCRPPDQRSNGDATNRRASSLRSVDLSTPIDRELVISQAGRCPSRGVYQLRLGDKSVLIIDHPRHRAARQAQIRPDVEAAFLTQPGTAFSSEDLANSSSMWVPPNTPHYDLTGRTITQEELNEETFPLADDIGKVIQNPAAEGSVYSGH